MNVLLDPWIPVRRQDGTIRRIAPAGVTAEYETNPAITVATPRPDFDGALTEFLIAVFQTLVLGGDEKTDRKEWRRLPDDPMSPDAITARLTPYKAYFALTGKEHCFFQDEGLLAAPVDKKDVRGIEALLIDAPGTKTVKENTDHFVQRGRVESLCECCTTAALVTLQLYSPAGGRGHMTGLRGGGPLTTLIRGRTLWLTIVWNLLPRSTFLALAGDRGATELAKRFPWMGPTRISNRQRDNDHVETTAEDVHPDQQFWAMPRRIRLLDYSGDEPDGKTVCDVCARRNGPFYERYVTRINGANYKNPWRHPLSPYYRDLGGMRAPCHPPFDGMSYRNWLGWVTADLSSKTEPAVALQTNRFRALQKPDSPGRLWAFGYRMAKRQMMKPLSWIEGSMPLLEAGKVCKAEFDVAVGQLVLGASEAEKALKTCVKKAAGNHKRSRQEFWERTELAFWESAEQVATYFAGSGGDLDEIRAAWLRELQNATEEIFDRSTQDGYFQAVDPGRVARAWNDMRRRLREKRIRQAIGLPPPQHRRASKSR